MNDGIETILNEIALLKTKREALDDLLSDRYKDVEKLLHGEGITKYVVGEGKEAITARLKRSTKLELSGSDALLASVADPLQFSRVLLETMSIPQKVVKALSDLGVDTTEFQKKKGKQYLEVTVGKESEVRNAKQEAQKKYIEDVESLRKSLSYFVLKSEAAVFFTNPILPDRGVGC